jgi:hypothetical protein
MLTMPPETLATAVAGIGFGPVGGAMMTSGACEYPAPAFVMVIVGLRAPSTIWIAQS